MGKRRTPMMGVAKAGTDYKVPPNCVRMDLNTNLLGPNPAVERFIDNRKVETHQYPSPDARDLRYALAKEWKVPADAIVCGNGVDDIINLTIKAFTKRGDKVAFPMPSFFMYEFFVRSYMCKPCQVPLLPGFQLDVDGLVKKKARVTFVATPNNPTGNKFRSEDLLRLLEEAEGIVALDEAYIEFAGGSFISKVRKFNNLMVYRTFSKAYAIAGLRVGVGVSARASEIMEVKPPFNLNLISEGAALVAVRNKAWLKGCVATIRKERSRLRKELRKLGFLVHPSDANFLLCKAPIDSGKLCQGLASKEVLIKDFGSVPKLEDHVRITVGGRKHTDMLLKRMKEVI